MDAQIVLWYGARKVCTGMKPSRQLIQGHIEVRQTVICLSHEEALELFKL